MTRTLLRGRELDVSIGTHTVTRGLNLDVQRGEVWVILGRNGAGKTTLLTTLAGLRPANAGVLLLDGQCYAAHGARAAARLRGLLSQHQGEVFPATVLETVLIGRHPHLGRWAWETEADHALALAALAETGLDGFARRDLATLSGGERQRVAIATLLTQAPALYLLDEPLTHLDLNHQIAILALLQRRRHEAAVVMTLHDVNLAARFATHILLLYGDGACELGTGETMLTRERLSRLYDHPLEIMENQGQRWFIPRFPPETTT